MSIGVGTLQPKSRVIRPVWIGALLALVAAVTLAVIVANSDDEPVRRTTSTVPLGGAAANTPSELSGGYVDGVGGTDFQAVPHVPKRTDTTAVGTQGNTPTEISGGNPDICSHQCR